MAQIPFQLSWTGHLQWLLCRMAALSSSGGRRRTGGGRRSQAMENGIQLFQQQTAESDVPHLLKLALLQGWEQVVGMAQLVLGSRGKPGCPVPVPKGTVLMAVWETHNCADSVETARKISSSTTLRSSSVPKWIQQLRTRKLQKPSKEYLSSCFCTEPSQFSAPALQGSPVSQGVTANTSNAFWVYLARPFWSQILPSCTISVDRKVLFNTRTDPLSFHFKELPLFPSFSFFFF